jgi:hypothetical protein
MAPHLTTLVLAVALHSPALAGSVELSGDTWRELAFPEVPEPAPAPGPRIADRSVQILPVEDGLELRARWLVETDEPGWMHGVLLGPGAHLEAVTWNGRPAVFAALSSGTVIAGWVEDRVEITLHGFLPGDPSTKAVPLRLLPSVRGSIVVEAEDLTVRPGGDERPVVVVDGRFATGAEHLEVALAPPPERERGTVAIAHAGVGVTVGDAEARGRAHLVWELRRGRLEAVAFRAVGVGPDLEVVGDNVRSWRRTGDRVEVELQAPVEQRLELEVRWTSAVPGGTEASLPLPRIEPLEAWRADAALQLARDGEVEVVPELTGWSSIPAAELPEWSRGLIEGTPTASFRAAGSAGGMLGLFRFQPVAMPPVVVDVASYTVATTEEGRLLGRAHYEVRNERAVHLRVVPPPGSRIIGVRVGGETALPISDGGSGWLVPLLRSVETVEGLLSFPVEVTLLGEEVPWDPRVERRLALPVVDAPIAVSRTTVYLPPGYRHRRRAGDGDVVETFTEGHGITYGFGVGDVGAARADALFQQAVSSWMANEFDEAQGWLDELGDMGAESENIERLQSNLDLVEGRFQADGAVIVQERRVREQARARGLKKEQAQGDYERQAEEAYRAGDLESAEEYFRSALEIGKTLEKLEQEEAVELETKVSGYRYRLEEIEQERDNREVSFLPDPNAAWDADDDKPGKASPVEEVPVAEEEPLVLWGQAIDGDEEMGAVGYEYGAGYGEIIVGGVGGLGVRGTGAGGGGSAGAYGGVLGTSTIVTEPTPSPTPEDEPKPEPPDHAVETAADSGAYYSLRKPRIRLPRIRIGGKRDKAGKAAAPEQDRTSSSSVAIQGAGDALGDGFAVDLAVAAPLERLPEPVATASALSVTIPAAGEAVRYQRKLLPADTAQEVVIRARIPPRKRSHR